MGRRLGAGHPGCVRRRRVSRAWARLPRRLPRLVAGNPGQAVTAGSGMSPAMSHTILLAVSRAVWEAWVCDPRWLRGSSSAVGV
jgi:hypothetical protein|eukprot:CAMPEP_0173271026 /NCGR_PEP_ID=MMETSP1143-20121109/580_1 /TAXON_ID=483371 /ORGANISM="non described non described, Strain CCMP2298" /LENGTH=83 /DNA_ID=CAMNT_0014207529 /DNA_START=416 /DNA_END=667 /DNA_ORIENTATION=-